MLLKSFTSIILLLHVNKEIIMQANNTHSSASNTIAYQLIPI